MTTLQEVDTRLTVVETILGSLATKSDLSEMNERFSARFSALEARMEAQEARMDSVATKTDLAELETRLVKWLVGVLIGSTAAASSIAVLVQTLVG